ncbi:MAG: helix-turn-helix domain-containing protein [Elusimicrobiota bacterium]
MELSDGLNYTGLFSEDEISIVKRVIANFRATNDSLKNSNFNDMLEDICADKLYPAKTKNKTLKKSMIVEIVKNALLNILEHQKTNKERVNYEKESLDKVIVDDKTGENVFLIDIIPDKMDFEKQVLSRMDFNIRKKKLTKIQKKICRLLEYMYSERKIAKKLKKSRNTISDEIKQIRNIFSEKT